MGSARSTRSVLFFVLLLNRPSTFVDHFASSPRRREKMDMRDCKEKKFML